MPVPLALSIGSGGQLQSFSAITLADVTAYLAGLPTSQPTTPSTPWLNNGVLTVTSSAASSNTTSTTLVMSRKGRIAAATAA